MSLHSDEKSLNAPIVAPWNWLRATIVAALAMVFVGAAIGFVGFLSQLRGAEIKPARNADGIVEGDGAAELLGPVVQNAEGRAIATA